MSYEESFGDYYRSACRDNRWCYRPGLRAETGTGVQSDDVREVASARPANKMNCPLGYGLRVSKPSFRTHRENPKSPPAFVAPSDEERELEVKCRRLFANEMLSAAKVGAEWKLTIIRPTDRGRKSLTEFEKCDGEDWERGRGGRQKRTVFASSWLRSTDSYAREVCSVSPAGCECQA